MIEDREYVPFRADDGESAERGGWGIAGVALVALALALPRPAVADPVDAELDARLTQNASNGSGRSGDPAGAASSGRKAAENVARAASSGQGEGGNDGESQSANNASSNSSSAQDDSPSSSDRSDGGTASSNEASTESDQTMDDGTSGSGPSTSSSTGGPGSIGPKEDPARTIQPQWLWDFNVDLVYGLLWTDRQLGGRVHTGAMYYRENQAWVMGFLGGIRPTTGEPELGARLEYQRFPPGSIMYVDGLTDFDGNATVAFGLGMVLLGAELRYRPGKNRRGGRWAGLLRFRIPISGTITVMDERVQ